MHIGEKIRHAKAIYEDANGFNPDATIKDWLTFADDVREYLKLETNEQVTTFLNIKVYKAGILIN